jgi:Co/Zn/Cd efflux system component
MTSVAAVGVVINVLAAWILAKANRQSLNVEGSFQHIVTDLYAFIGTLIAGVVILTTGFDRADAIASIFVAVLMIRSGFHLQRRALRVLLESAPEDLVPAAVGEAMVHTALGFERVSCGLTDEPVAEIVQCGEPLPNAAAAASYSVGQFHARTSTGRGCR